MSDQTVSPRLKPLFLVKPKTMSARDIQRAEKLAGVCIVECADPETARFLEPPIDANIDVQARAALSLMRYIVKSTGNSTTTHYGATLIKMFVETILSAPTPAVVPRVGEMKR